jgi:uncharacterized membrane protein
MDKEIIKQGKTSAIISYILIVGPLIAISINSEVKNPFSSFHIRQGLGLTLTFITLGITISHFESVYIAAPMWIFISVLSAYGLFLAATGQVKNIPILGNLFQKWLKFL